MRASLYPMCMHGQVPRVLRRSDDFYAFRSGRLANDPVSIVHQSRLTNGLNRSKIEASEKLYSCLSVADVTEEHYPGQPFNETLSNDVWND
jgi:hypothetical protein